MAGGPRYRNRVEADDSWREHAACRNHPHPEWWFATPENLPLGPRKYNEGEKNAIRVCVTLCPVKDACYQYAMEKREDHHIWGGSTDTDRRTDWRRWQRQRQRERAAQ